MRIGEMILLDNQIFTIKIEQRRSPSDKFTYKLLFDGNEINYQDITCVVTWTENELFVTLAQYFFLFRTFFIQG